MDDDCDGLTDLSDGNCVSCLQDEDCEDNNPCTTDVCTDSECSNNAVADDTLCVNDLSCTENDKCREGTCGGDLLDCSGLDGTCLVGVCDELEQGCVAKTADNNTPCDDLDPCTSDDKCLEGECSGQLPDGDSDGFIDVQCGGDDCDDSDNTIHPNANEGPYGDGTCQDGADNNCDEMVDDGDYDCQEHTHIYRSVGSSNTDPLETGDPGQLTITGSKVR